VASRQYISEVRLKRDQVPSFDRYPFSLPAVRNLDAIELHPQVTFFIGENGSGKSTLLEAIAVAWGFNAEGGTRNFRFGTRVSHSELNQYLVLAKDVHRPKDGFFLRAESFFNVATEIERIGVTDSYGDRSLHEQSHGESFMALLLNRFSGKGLYLLDEPEAALSPQRQLSVITRIHDLISDESQFIIATHSPILMAYPNATIYGFSQDGVSKIDYYETEHYQVTHDFLANPKRMLDILMEPSPDAPPPPKKRGRR